MLIETAIKTAIKYETKIKELYLEAAGKSTDELGKRFFNLLATEEAGHVDYLNAKLETWLKKRELKSDDLKMVLAHADLKAAQADVPREMLSEDVRQDELALLKKAWEVEVETSNFYDSVVADLPPEGKAMFKRFLEIEQGHIDIVQFEIDSLTGSGFYMGIQEFDMEKMG